MACWPSSKRRSDTPGSPSASGAREIRHPKDQALSLPLSALLFDTAKRSVSLTVVVTESVPPRGRDCVKTADGCPRLARGRFTLSARNEQQLTFIRCHRLARWSLTFLAICCQGQVVSSKREPPRGKPVASKEASSDLFSSNHRETPPDKPVASLRVFTQSHKLTIIAVLCAVVAGVGVAMWMKHEQTASAETLPNAARILLCVFLET